MKSPAVFQPVGHLLECGNCEPFKATIHGAVLTLAALCAAYNTAAWLKRREPHLAINAALYALTVFWERAQVTRHILAHAPHTDDTVSELIDAA